MENISVRSARSSNSCRRCGAFRGTMRLNAPRICFAKPRRAAMPVAEQARRALNLKSLSLPASLPVLRVDAEDYTDWEGEPALRVQVVLDESVDPEHVSGEDVGELKFAIREALRKHGVTLFPYIFLATQSELDQPADAEE